MRGQIIYVPLDKAQEPVDGHAYVNRWWAVHPEKGVAFYIHSLRLSYEGEPVEPSPQCNASEAAVRHLTARSHPDCDVVFVPVVFAHHARRELVRLHNAAKAVLP